MTPKRKWTTIRLFLQIAGAVGLLTWLLFAPYALSERALSALAVGLLLGLLYRRLVAAHERKQIRRETAEKICNACLAGPPGSDDSPVPEHAPSSPAVKALMAEHDRIARDLELMVVARGYRRRDIRKAIAIGRYEHGMYSYEALMNFVLGKLSSEYPDISQIADERSAVGEGEPIHR
jgi:hypothetical protein